MAFKVESVEVVVGGAATPSWRLYRRVRPDECTWTIEGGKKVVVTLAKVDERCTPSRRSSERHSGWEEVRREAARTSRALAPGWRLPSLCFVSTENTTVVSGPIRRAAALGRARQSPSRKRADSEVETGSQ